MTAASPGLPVDISRLHFWLASTDSYDKLMVFLRHFKPPHAANRMAHEGDVLNARRDYEARSSDNLRRLLAARFLWMNDYIAPDHKGVDVGCGAGFSSYFIRSARLYLTDYAEFDFLDFKNIDALHLPFADSSLDYVIATNTIHHLPSPLAFFDEAWRVLTPGGHLLLFEVHASLLFRLILRLMRHEGFDDSVKVFDRGAVCTDPDDLWAGNNYIPRLLFDDHEAFLAAQPQWRILRDRRCECLLFLNSGGVTAKTFFIPLPGWGLSLVEAVDNILSHAAPNLFALGRQIALRKTMDPLTV